MQELCLEFRKVGLPSKGLWQPSNARIRNLVRDISASPICFLTIQSWWDCLTSRHERLNFILTGRRKAFMSESDIKGK